MCFIEDQESNVLDPTKLMLEQLPTLEARGE
jgi:hypothetical protein